MKAAILAPIPDPGGMIRTLRGQRLILDADLARVYGVPTHRFNEAVKRNRGRFPEDFVFRLTAREFAALRSQSAISKPGRGGRRTPPYAFTEHGATMAANVLNSRRAVAMSVYVIRAFIRLREAVLDNQTLARRVADIEKTLVTHDAALRDLCRKIRPLLLPPSAPAPRKIGFHP